MIEKVIAELARVRLQIAALQGEETDLVIALHVLERLDGVNSARPLILDLGDLTATSASATGPRGVTETTPSNGLLTNVGAIEVSVTVTSSATVQIIESPSEPPACEPEAEPEVEPPPPPAAPARSRGGFQVGSGEPSAPLFEELKAEGERRGLSVQQVSIAVFGNKARIYQLRNAAIVRRSTADKIRAWIADAPSDDQSPPKVEGAAEQDPALEPAQAERTPPVAPQPPPRIDPTPFELHREISAFLASTGVRAIAFGTAVNGDRGLVAAIRDGRAPRAKTIAKIRAIIADPPAGLLQRRPPMGDRRYAENRAPAAPRRDPTLKPETPLGDLAERQRAKGQRHRAAIARSRDQHAANLVDAGADPAKQNTMVAAQMREVARRRAEEARQVNPVHQAKLALQRKGRTVYDASVCGGKKGHFHVSGKRDGNGRLLELTPAALLDEAERVTGQSFRRAPA